MEVADIRSAFVGAMESGRLSGNVPNGLAELLDSIGAASIPVTEAAVGSDDFSAWLTCRTMYLQTE